MGRHLWEPQRNLGGAITGVPSRMEETGPLLRDGDLALGLRLGLSESEHIKKYVTK